MAEDEFTQIRIKKTTQRKIGILARALEDVSIYSLVDAWAEQEWQRAVRLGVVSDKMLTTTVQAAHFVQAPEPDLVDAGRAGK